MNPTQYPEINILLQNLIKYLRIILRSKFVGMYIIGSLATGDFDYDISDIDIIIATSDYLNKQEINELKGFHSKLTQTKQDWEDGLEVVYIPLKELRRYSPSYLLPHVSPGESFQVSKVGAEWILNRFVLRKNGIKVFGPDVKNIVDLIPRAEVIQSVITKAKEWHAYLKSNKKIWSRNYQAYLILTMCRMLQTYKTGDFTSKKQAGIWATKNLDPQWKGYIEKAFKWRKDWRNKDVNNKTTLVDTLEFVYMVLDQIVC